MAPSYANIYMSEFEGKYLPFTPIQPVLSARYIDDILAISVCADEELTRFEKWNNNLHPTIKIILDSNQEGIPFLGTLLLTIEDNRIRVQLYTK